MALDLEKLRNARPTAPAGRDLVEGPWKFIVDEHPVHDPETGEQLFTVTPDDLERAATKGNQRILDTGDFAPLTLGHTVDGVPEDRQPEIVGFAGPYEVRDLYGTGRKAIAAKEWYYHDKADEVQKYPRRSVEVTWASHLIDPIACLGATTPARDLGLHNAHQGKKFRYQMPEAAAPEAPKEDPVMNPDELVAKVVAALQQTAQWKLLDTLAEERQTAAAQAEDLRLKNAAEGGGASASATNVSPPAPMGEKDKHLEEYRRYNKMAMDHVEAGEHAKADEALKMAHQHLSKCSAGPTPDPATDERPSEKLRMQMEQAAIKLRQYEDRDKTREEEVRQLKLRNQRSDRLAELIQLEAAEGILFDRAEELDTVAEMPEEAYRRHLARMKARYSRAPVGGVPIPTSSDPQRPTPGGHSPISGNRDLAQKAIDLASQEGITYGDALARVSGGK